MKPAFAARATSIASLLALTVVTCPSARAADPVLMNSSATLTGLTYKLVDLDPTDGVTPWVRFSTQATLDAGAASSTFNTPVNSFLPSTTQTLSSTDGLSTAAAGPNQMSSSAALKLSNLPFSSSPTSSSSSADATTTGVIDATTGLPASAITLSAHTRLVITGTVNLQTTRDFNALQTALNASTADHLVIYGDSNSSATISLVINGGTDAEVVDSFVLGNPSSSFSGSLYRNAGPIGFSMTDSYASGASPFSVQVDNTAKSSALLDFYASIGGANSVGVTGVYLSSPAVPEPSTYLLTGLGLAAAGAVASKRGTASRRA